MANITNYREQIKDNILVGTTKLIYDYRVLKILVKVVRLWWL